MIEGKENKMKTAGTVFLQRSLNYLFSPLFLGFFSFFRDYSSLTLWAAIFQRSSTQWDLSLHTGIFTNATQMKRPPSPPLLQLLSAFFPSLCLSVSSSQSGLT